MEFLYSLNRLNVATSRAKAMVIAVGSPRLLEPDCRTPRHMQLAPMRFVVTWNWLNRLIWRLGWQARASRLRYKCGASFDAIDW